MSERRHRQSAATKLPAGGRVPGHEGLRIVQLLPQDVRAGGDEGREKRRAGGAGGGSGQPGRRAPPGDRLPVLQSDWLSERRPPVPSPLPCAPAAPSPPSQRGDSWGPFLLRNINGFPLPPGAGNRHQLAPPTQTAGCQPARRPRTTWEEAPPQAARAFRRRPLGSQSKLVNLARPPHPAVGRVRPPGTAWAVTGPGEMDP